MGACCDKEGPPNPDYNDIDMVEPYYVFTRKEEVPNDPTRTSLGIYPMNNRMVYLYGSSTDPDKINKYWITNNLIEVITYETNPDLLKISKQIDQILKLSNHSKSN